MSGLSFPSFTAAAATPEDPNYAAGLTRGSGGSTAELTSRQSPPPPPPPYQQQQQQQQQPSSLSAASSLSTFMWGRFEQPAVPPEQNHQQQVEQQLLRQPGSAMTAAEAQLYTPADSQTQPTHGSSGLPGISPSESSNSLAQYSILAGLAGLAGGGGGGNPSGDGSRESVSLLMSGPGSLCAALPRYVRHPPIEAVVFGWGVSDDGQLGLAEGRGDVVVPKVVEALLGVQFSGRSFCRTPLVAGSRNTLALDAAGGVWSFGWNDRGTLGQGHRSREGKPKRIAALKGIRVVQIAIGGWHCLAMSDRGTMFAWGGNEYGQCGSVLPGQRDITEPLPVDLGLGPNQRVRQVAAGGMHSLALLEDGTVWQWGENWGDFSMHPLRTPRPVPGAVAVAAVACGAFHNLALTAGGRVLSWGMNDYGQLGNGSTTYATAPRPVLDMDGVVVADIAAGGWHSCALSGAGEVWVWGRGEYGRLGLGDRSGSSKLRPQKVRGLEAHVVVQVAAGGSHTLALTSAARLFVWGRGAFGRLGLGDPPRDCYHPVECPLPGGVERWRVAAIGAGGRHSICLAIPVRDTATSGMAEPDWGGVGTGIGLMGGPMASYSASYSDIAAAAAAAAGLTLPPHLAAAHVGGGGGFGSLLSQQLQQLHSLHLASLQGGQSYGLSAVQQLQSQQLQSLGRGGGGSGVGDEFDNVDGLSEPSLYDRDMMQYESVGLLDGPSPVRTRRQTVATADGSITAASSIVAIAAMAAVAGGSSGGGGAVGGSGGGGCGAAGAGSGSGAAQSATPPPPPPDLQPLRAQESLSDWPSLDSRGAAVSTDSNSVTAPPPTPADPTASPSPSQPPQGGVAAAAAATGASGSAPPSQLPPASDSSASVLSSVAAAPPSKPLLPQRTVSTSSAQPPRPPSPAVTAAAVDASAAPVDPPRVPAHPKSPLRPPQAPAALQPMGVSYGMRKSSSAIGPLSQLSQILPEPAAVAAAAVLDADSDLAPPRGLAAAAAAVAAAAAAVSGPASLHGSVGNGGGGSHNGSLTGMMRYRTVFGGGGEEEDEAMQAAEAAEEAAELNEGSGAGEDEVLGDLEGGLDDTDEDQLYDSASVQHPRSPSLMSRPRSPTVPLSPRRHQAFGPLAAAGVGGGLGSSRSGSPAVMGASTGIAGGNGGGGTISRSPSGRALLPSYGSPRMPSGLP